MSAPALVILAAGVGSRYGGPKQIEPLGPGGATLLDYSVYDARRTGFAKVVVVTRPELAAAFERLNATVALQRLEDLPAGQTLPSARTKPWGTGHAVLAAASEVSGPFAVVNADDFYGRDAFTRAAEFLASGHGGESRGTFANIAYPLGDTLSAAGGVNRAVCRADGDGWLETVDEIVDIRRLGDGAYQGTDPRGRLLRLAADALVSMNMWAFTPLALTLLRSGFAEFLRQDAPGRSEFLIPRAIGDAVRRGEARVRLLRTHGRWLGVTYPDDRPRVEAALRQLVDAGHYPERLWT
ncbi:MAG TPA: NTP transferase domain-containing protein [Gemmatimonadales bacterium]